MSWSRWSNRVLISATRLWGYCAYSENHSHEALTQSWKKPHELEVKLNITMLWKTDHRRTNVVLWYIWTVPMMTTVYHVKVQGHHTFVWLGNRFSGCKLFVYFLPGLQTHKHVRGIDGRLLPYIFMSPCGSRTILCHHCFVDSNYRSKENM